MSHINELFESNEIFIICRGEQRKWYFGIYFIVRILIKCASFPSLASIKILLDSAIRRGT